MPIYEFKCNDCSIVFESFVTSAKYSDTIKCPKCGSGKVSKQVSSFSFGGRSFGYGGAASNPGPVPAPGGCGTGRFS